MVNSIKKKKIIFNKFNDKDNVSNKEIYFVVKSVKYSLRHFHDSTFKNIRD